MPDANTNSNVSNCSLQYDECALNYVGSLSTSALWVCGICWQNKNSYCQQCGFMRSVNNGEQAGLDLMISNPECIRWVWLPLVGLLIWPWLHFPTPAPSIPVTSLSWNLSQKFSLFFRSLLFPACPTEKAKSFVRTHVKGSWDCCLLTVPSQWGR